MLNILITILAPIIIVAGLGALLDRTKSINTSAISRIAIYLASPGLTFHGLATSSLTGTELGSLALFFALVITSITLLAWLIGAGFRMNRVNSSVFILSAALINIGNYGIPFNTFAFGRPGMERAVLLSTLGALTANTLGIFLASSGRASIRQALSNMFKVPLPYAAALGITVNLTHMPVPELIMRVTDLLGQMAVPLMLLMLGIQISRVSLRGQWGFIMGASLMRLVGGAALGFLFSALLGLQGVTHNVAIIEAAMPTAVFTTVLASEFDNDTQLVSSIVLVSTLLSLLTLPAILYFLLGGI